MAADVYFLDASVVISAFDSADRSAREAASALLEPVLRDEQAAIAISPLVQYEVMRSRDPSSPQSRQLLERLGGFTMFDITDRIAMRAAALFRQERAHLRARAWQGCLVTSSYRESRR